MSEKEILNNLKDCIVNLDIQCIQQACREALASNIQPIKAINEGMVAGMTLVGQKYEEGEYFLSELIMSAEVMSEGLKILEPHLKGTETLVKGTVVIGTVRGDLHDLGKNLVVTLLKIHGFRVVDLGIDVSAEDFVKAVRTHTPDVLGMSALLSTTMPEMEHVIKELKKNGLRDQVKIIVGGAHVTPQFAEIIGADAAAKSAVEGVTICNQWISN